MKPPLRDADFREKMRARLLAVAKRLIVDEGLAAVQARRVASEAGCSVGTVYNVYGDIDGLVLAANATTLHDLGSALETVRKHVQGQDVEERLMALAVTYLDFAISSQRRWRAVFEHRLPDGYPTPESYIADRRALLALIEAELAQVLPDADQRIDAARALFSATHGNVLLALDGKLGDIAPDQCERQIRFLVHHVVSGLSR
jgi:AcrR family transcriptional regulator